MTASRLWGKRKTAGGHLLGLLSGVARKEEYKANHHINSMCHECNKTTRLLLGVAKYKES